MLLKITFEIPFFLVEEECEQSAAFDYYKYDVHVSYRINRWDLQKKLYVVVTFVASSLFSFLNILFSKYVQKVLATFYL